MDRGIPACPAIKRSLHSDPGWESHGARRVLWTIWPAVISSHAPQSFRLLGTLMNAYVGCPFEVSRHDSLSTSRVVVGDFGPSHRHAALAQNNNFNNPGGIRIDAGGVVSILAPTRESAAAAKKRQQAFLSANLSPDLAKSTVTRRVSLKQLDQQLAELARDGKEIPLELRYLAGITQIEQVVVDREAADLSILGPAEGFAPDLSGRMRGITTGRPVLNLEDLLVAWRTVQSGQTVVTCSIDPTEEGIAAFKAYSSQNQVAATPAAIAQIFQTMAERLGRQTITLSGVPGIPISQWSWSRRTCG